MHGNPTTHDRGRVIWTEEAVDVQVKILPLKAGSWDSLVLGRKGQKNDVFVPRVEYWLAHILQTLAIAVHDVKKIVGIIADFILVLCKYL